MQSVLVEEPVQLALPMAVHLFVLLALVCVYAFRNPRTRLGRWRYVAAGLLVWSYLASTPGVANAFIARLESRHGPAAAQVDGEPLILVLSSGYVVKQGGRDEVKLDQAGWERTWAGIRLWQQIGGRLLFAGGGPEPDNTGAGVMAGVACAAGVPREAVLIENQSRNTYENLAFSRDLVLAAGPRAFLVTSAMHMPRAMATAEKLGLKPHPHPCDYRAIQLQSWYAWIPNSGGPSLLSDFLHEWVGLQYYRLKGFAA